jgi:hypothetical protein
LMLFLVVDGNMVVFVGTKGVPWHNFKYFEFNSFLGILSQHEIWVKFRNINHFYPNLDFQTVCKRELQKMKLSNTRFQSLKDKSSWLNSSWTFSVLYTMDQEPPIPSLEP